MKTQELSNKTLEDTTTYVNILENPLIFKSVDKNEEHHRFSGELEDNKSKKLLDQVRIIIREELNNHLLNSVRKRTIPIFCNEEYHLVEGHEIIRLEAEESYTKIVLVKGELFSSKPLGYYEKILTSISFIRCHKSHIININKVIRVSRGRGRYAVTCNEDIVPISLVKKDIFNEALGI